MELPHLPLPRTEDPKIGDLLILFDNVMIHVRLVMGVKGPQRTACLRLARHELHLLHDAAAALGADSERARLARPGAVALHEAAVAQAVASPEVLVVRLVSILAVRRILLVLDGHGQLQVSHLSGAGGR